MLLFFHPSFLSSWGTPSILHARRQWVAKIFLILMRWFIILAQLYYFHSRWPQGCGYIPWNLFKESCSTTTDIMSYMGPETTLAALALHCKVTKLRTYVGLETRRPSPLRRMINLNCLLDSSARVSWCLHFNYAIWGLVPVNTVGVEAPSCLKQWRIWIYILCLHHLGRVLLRWKW